MRERVAVVVSLLTACGNNPAFLEPTATTSTTSTTGTPPAATSTTGALPDPTTTGATTLGLDATGDTSTTSTGTTDTADTTTGAADTTSTSTTGDATTGSPAPGECPVDDPSLIACYRFEEDPPFEDLLDGSANGLDGSRASTQAVGSLEGYANAVELVPGSDVHVGHDPAFTPKAITLAAFVYIKKDPMLRGLIEHAGSYRLSLTGGVVTCWLQTDQDDAEVSIPINLEGWHHISCSFDGDDLELHLNGADYHPMPVEAGLAGDVADSRNSELMIGRIAGDDATKFSGWMDHVTVFSRALSDSAVCDLAGPLCS